MSIRQHTKERDYTLTRLVRGLGASTLASRAGYFTALVGFLSRPSAAVDITHDQLIAVLDKQLHVGKACADKEDSDALVGHVLLVGALLRSGRLRGGDAATAAATDEQVAQCAQILVRAAASKVFHASLAYKFLVDLLHELPAEQFHCALWPAVRRDVARPWERHTCNTLHFLLVAHDKYPEVVDAAFLQKTLKTAEILTPLAHKHLGRVFWGNTSLAAITHPAYEALSRFLLSVKRKQLVAFWQGEIAETLAAPNKIKEVVTVKVLTDFLQETAQPLESRILLKLLTPRVIRMMVTSLRALKLQQHDVLASFYAEFFEALHAYFGSAPLVADDAGRVAILQRFVLHPGTLLIEKYLPQKSVHQLITRLGAEGVRSMFALYKSVFLAQLPKPTETAATAGSWQNVERVHAAQMMQYLLAQKCVQQDVEWRTEQLKFLLTVGLFHVSADGSEAVRKEQVAAGAGAVTKELALHARNLFYASLQMRLPQLADEKRLLLAIVEHAHRLVGGGAKHVGKLLRSGDWPTETAAAWQQMHEAVQRAGKSEKTLTLVFQILFLHMGLQLFREPEMARVAVADLVQCMEKTKQAKKVQKRQRKSLVPADASAEAEPEWIEVVVDLFLHLLSQNTSFMRNVVSNVFPQLCGEMTLTAVHQVLAMLDMKDGKNPLSAGVEGDDEEEKDGEDVQDEEDEDEEDDAEMKSDDDEDDDEDDDDDDEDVMEDDEGTVSDQLRNAVSTALGALLPAAKANAAVDDDDDDAASCDLNDMDDAEAARLDDALSAAFQSIRKSGNAAADGSAKSKKKTKAQRTINTTVMHFRIRVLDLIDIYLKNAPALSVSLEILLALFNMIEYCTDSDLRPLADCVDRVLRRLLALRQFGNVDDVSAANLGDLLQSLVAKKVNPVRLSVHNQLLSKTVAFLIASAQLLPVAKAPVDPMLALIGEYTDEFVVSRNPRVQASLLQDIFGLRWPGVWQLGRQLAERALAETRVRKFRRTQALQLLAVLYRNHGFIAANVAAFGEPNGHIGRTVAGHVTWLAAHPEVRVSAREFDALVELLVAVRRCEQVKALKVADVPAMQWDRLAGEVQTVRQRVVLAAPGAYKRFCQAVGVQALKNVAVEVAEKPENSDDEEAEEEKNGGEAAEETKALKRKTDDRRVDNKREQKRIKLERMRLASIGLLEDDDEDEDDEDDDEEEEDSD